MSRRTWSACVLLPALVVGRAALAAEPARQYTAQPGPHPVAELLLEWHDAARNRDVPVKVYYPSDAAVPCPVIVFSHGLGGSREGYAYLGRHWAGCGYVVIHVQHLGSDDAVWRGAQDLMAAMRRAAANPQNAINRPKDVSYVIDQLPGLNTADGPLKGRLDPSRVAVAGHSFGGYTTLASAGETFILPGNREATLADPRIKAAIAMSAPVPGSDLDRAYAHFRTPCYHLTGTLDDSPIGDTKAVDRRKNYDHIPGPDQYLTIFKDGDHMVFSGVPGRRAQRRLYAAVQGYIVESTTAFWDAYLKGDAGAKAWLKGFAAVLGRDGTFESK